MNAAYALSLYIYLHLCSSFFRILRMIMKDDVDNNSNNEDQICHGTNDSKSSSEYESDVSDDGIDVQPQPQHRSIRGRGLVRARGGRFRRCGRVGAQGHRADGGRGSGAHSVPRVANQPVASSYITDFENPNVDKLFHENEGSPR